GGAAGLQRGGDRPGPGAGGRAGAVLRAGGRQQQRRRADVPPDARGGGRGAGGGAGGGGGGGPAGGAGHHGGVGQRASRGARLRGGRTGEGVLGRRERLATTAVPDNVRQEVRGWGEWVRTVTAAAATLIRCPDEATADRVHGALGRKAERLNATTVAFPAARV